MLSKKLIKKIAVVFETRQRQLFVAALAITRERASAEDAVQDALLSTAALNVAPAELENYLFRTVRNKALHSVKRDRRIDRNVDPADFLDVADSSQEQRTFAAGVMTCLGELDENPRQVIVMKLFADFTFDDIAKIMDSSPNTVASWYRRGLRKMKEQMNEIHAI
ncbi:MAG: RNA polymerase sigma factor [Pseudohongiellaceae bacterium]